jgi:hypothetical protein
MASHCTYRIAEGTALLDLQSFDGIGVIRAPDLGTIVHHACIVTSAATGASLDHEFRISLQYPV